MAGLLAKFGGTRAWLDGELTFLDEVDGPEAAEGAGSVRLYSAGLATDEPVTTKGDPFMVIVDGDLVTSDYVRFSPDDYMPSDTVDVRRGVGQAGHHDETGVDRDAELVQLPDDGERRIDSRRAPVQPPIPRGLTSTRARSVPGEMVVGSGAEEPGGVQPGGLKAVQQRADEARLDQGLSPPLTAFRRRLLMNGP